jgi:DNA-binding transcriptional regulator GbsR (MarR family)
LTETGEYPILPVVDRRYDNVTGKRQDKHRAFAEDLGILVEEMGLPPAAGRIWGWLLVCDPPHQTADQLADALGISLGSVSTMTRMLMQFGIVERIGLPGERKRFYRFNSRGFSSLLKLKQDQTSRIREWTERGLALLDGESEEAKLRLRLSREFYAVFEQEFPRLITKWEKARDRMESQS